MILWCCAMNLGDDRRSAMMWWWVLIVLWGSHLFFTHVAWIERVESKMRRHACTMMNEKPYVRAQWLLHCNVQSRYSKYGELKAQKVRGTWPGELPQVACAHPRQLVRGGLVSWPWERLPPGGATCHYFDTCGARVPRPITSTRGNRDLGGPASASANSGPPWLQDVII
jgi:hypothetical protein